MKNKYFVLLIIIACSILNCKKDITAVESFYTYTPLNVGDVRQILNTLDSSLTLFSIVGKYSLNKSQNIYLGEWKKYKGYADTLYYFIKDGYLATAHTKNLDFLSYGAKSNPVDGETWQLMSESNENIIKAKYFETFLTPCGKFYDVFGFTLIKKSNGLAYGTSYYAKNIGYLGSAFYDYTELYIYCKYIKVFQKEYGNLLSLN